MRMGTRVAKGRTKDRYTVYVERELAARLRANGVRLDRSIEWLVARCIEIAMPAIDAMPSLPEVDDD